MDEKRWKRAGQGEYHGARLIEGAVVMFVRIRDYGKVVEERLWFGQEWRAVTDPGTKSDVLSDCVIWLTQQEVKRAVLGA